MSITTPPTVNGRRDSRPSLGQQIDRLDRILDGLAEAIPATVADSIKQSVAVAVGEAVRATILEIAASPELIAQLRQAPAPEPEKKPQTVVGRIGAFVGGAWNRLVSKCKAAGGAIMGTSRKVGGAVDELNRVWSLRTPVLIALGVGTVFGVTVALSSPWLSGILSGISAAAATLGAQFIAFTRRMCARLSMT